LSAWTATKLLKLKPFKTTVVHELQPHDPANRVNYCKWILQSVHDSDINHHSILFSETWSQLHSEVHSQNSTYWSSHNQRQKNEVPLHNSKTGIWCSVSADRITGLNFFKDTINSEQNSATGHTARTSTDALNEVFGDKIIST
jgi:hypothetical protein